MTNKTTIIILVVILVLALGFLSFSIYFYMTKRGGMEVVEQPITRPITQPTQPSVPVITSESFNKVFGDARAAMDPEICSQLATSDEVRNCADKVNLLIAYQGRDISLCRGVFDTQLRDSCYVNLGLSLGVQYCKYLTDPALKQSCEEDQNIE